ncbi:MAG: PTS galactitol transporter subunit IIC [Anaerolineaceae bacterium]
MNMFMQVIQFMMDAGSSVFMPVILLILGLIFGLKFGRAIKAGVLVGIGFIGINLVLGLLGDNLAGIVDKLVELYNFKLTAIDVGWPVAGSVAWANGVLVPIVIVAVLITNIILIALKFTKTLDVDIWNYWQPLFAAGAIYMVTGNMVVAVVSACLIMAIIFKIADFSQPYIESYFGIKGVSVPHVETTGWAIIGIPLNKLIDKIPGLNKIEWTTEKLQEKLGVFGDPIFIGLAMGLLLALFARMPATEVLQASINTAAAMFLLPKMIGVLMEGLQPISEAAAEFVRSRFKDRELFIGLDSAIIVGHPSVITVALLLIPTTLLLAVIWPLNITLPLAELSGLCFFVVWAVVPSKGNIFRGWLIGILIMLVVLTISSDYAPIMTNLAKQVGYEIPEGASLITCLSIGSQWISYIFFKISSLLFGQPV